MRKVDKTCRACGAQQRISLELDTEEERDLWRRLSEARSKMYSHDGPENVAIFWLLAIILVVFFFSVWMFREPVMALCSVMVSEVSGMVAIGSWSRRRKKEQLRPFEERWAAILKEAGVSPDDSYVVVDQPPSATP